jgi:hypothetical protein
MRQLCRGSVEIAVVEQNPQAAQHVLLAAAVERGKMTRRQKAVPGYVGEQREIALRKLEIRWTIAALKTLRP